jgi:hypothetical protein
VPAEASPTAPAAFVFKSPAERPEIARFVVVAPREMMALVEEERVRIVKMEEVPFPVIVTSAGKT